MSYNTVSLGKTPPPTLEQFISTVKTYNLSRQERFFVDFSFAKSINITQSGDIVLESLPSEFAKIRLLCDNITLPTKIINNKTLRINGLTERRVSTLDYGENITLDFMVDAKYDVRQFFENWMNLCVSSRETGNEVNFYNKYALPINLYALMPAGIPGEKYLNLNLDNINGLRDIADGAGIASGVLRKTIGFGLNKANNFIAKKKGELLNAVERRTAGIRNVGALGLARDLLTEEENIVFNIVLRDCWPINISPIPMSWSNPGVGRLSVTFVYKSYKSNYETNINSDLSPND